MRLHSLVPTIPDDLVATLEACGIRTDVDLLFFGTPIDILQKLPPGVVSLADLKTCIRLVAESASARGIPGDALYAEQLQQRHEHDIDMTCGVDELDALVSGFGGGRVFEISGDRGSGKTVCNRRDSIATFLNHDEKLLVSQIALRLLMAYRETSVLWMDTTGDFSVERTRQMAQRLGGEVTVHCFHCHRPTEYPKNSSVVLERLQVSLVLNIETARVLLEELESSLTVCMLMLD